MHPPQVGRRRLHLVAPFEEAFGFRPDLPETTELQHQTRTQKHQVIIKYQFYLISEESEKSLTSVCIGVTQTLQTSTSSVLTNFLFALQKAET